MDACRKTRIGVVGGAALALALSAALVAPPFAWAGSTGVVGSGGTESYNLDCGWEKVLVGINARTGQHITKIQGICAGYHPDTGAWQGALSETAWSVSTAPQNAQGQLAARTACAQGFAVAGFTGRAKPGIEALTVICRKIVDSKGHVRGSLVPSVAGVGDSGSGTPFGQKICPNNGSARALRGRSAAHVQTLEMECRP